MCRFNLIRSDVIFSIGVSRKSWFKLRTTSEQVFQESGIQNVFRIYEIGQLCPVRCDHKGSTMLLSTCFIKYSSPCATHEFVDKGFRGQVKIRKTVSVPVHHGADVSDRFWSHKFPVFALESPDGSRYANMTRSKCLNH